MSAYVAVDIKTDEQFEVFQKAPIVEAVIDIRARATPILDESLLRSNLEKRLKDYTFLDSLREVEGEMKFGGGDPPRQTIRDLGWKGVRFRSIDQKHIVQFNRDGLVFSRLQPYMDWRQLCDKGLSLWIIFKELALPIEIHRVGLRFINRIILPPGELKLEEYIYPAPALPKGLEFPFTGYMHQDKLAVPGHPYAINVIQTIQLPQPNEIHSLSLILDIDVFTIQGFEPEEDKLRLRLEEMRWLKDKVFFGSITEKAKEMFR